MKRKIIALAALALLAYVSIVGAQALGYIPQGPTRFPNTGLMVSAPNSAGTSDSKMFRIVPGSSATARRDITIVTGDADRSIDVSAGNVVLPAGTGVATTDARLSDDRTASGLRSASTLVTVSGATAPSAGQVLKATSSTAASWQSLSYGDMSGPASSTDNAVCRYDGTTGKQGQDSLVIIDDSGNVSLPALATVDGRDISVDHAVYDLHILDTSNPHSVTKAQVGLGNVTNAAQVTSVNGLGPGAVTLAPGDIGALGEEAGTSAGTTLYVDGAALASSSSCSLLFPCLHIQDAVNLIPAATTTAEMNRVWVVDVRAGYYDEDLSIDLADRKIRFDFHGLVGLGLFNGTSGTASSVRNITITGDLTSHFSSLRSHLMFVALDRDRSTGGPIEAGFQLSGNVDFSGITNTPSVTDLVFVGARLFGSPLTTGDALLGPASFGSSNLIRVVLIDSSILARTTGNMALTSVASTAFSGDISVYSLNTAVLSTFTRNVTFNSGITGLGLFNCDFGASRTWSSPTNVPMNAETYYRFTAQSGAVSGGGSVVVAEAQPSSTLTGAALSVAGRSANSSGAFGDIACSAGSGGVLRESGSVLGCGQVATAGLTDDSVTYAKLQNASATDLLLCRSSASSGDWEECTFTDGGQALMAMAGVANRVPAYSSTSATTTVPYASANANSTLIQSTSGGRIDSSWFPAFTGDVTTSAGGVTTTIANDAVTNTQLRNSSALSVIGRSANSSGDPADIAASNASDAVLRESGGVLGFGTVATAGVADAAITAPKIADGLLGGSVIGDANDSVMLPKTIDRGNAITVTPGTTYCIYYGRTAYSKTLASVRLMLSGSSAATSTQTAEVAIMSSSSAPDGANKTLTKLAASGSITAMAPSVTNALVVNTSSLAYTIAAGVHVWTCVRVSMAGTQPSFNSTIADYGTGRVCSATGVGALTSATSFTCSTISSGTTNPAPYMTLTTF
jgi:hypothetical protein